MSTTELAQLRDRVLELLKREGRAMHTGEIAVMLKVATHQVHSAMHHSLQRREIDYTSSGGYQLPPVERRPASDGKQVRID